MILSTGQRVLAWIKLDRLIAVAVVLVIFTSACSSEYSYSGAVSDPAWSVPDFELVDHRNESFEFSENDGRLSVVFFGYAACPDVCPTTLSDLVRVKQNLETQSENVRFIWITVDPERDDPNTLATRLSVFDSEFIALTGSRSSLEAVWSSFRVQVEKDQSQGSGAGYLISHTANTYLLTPDGTVVVEFPFGTNPSGMASDIEHVLKQTKRKPK